MKPLPLLITLVVMAAVAGGLLVARKPNIPEPVPPAPLPSDTLGDTSLLELEPLLPEVIRLNAPYSPDPTLLTFVEKHLGTSFPHPPIFQPVSDDELVAHIDSYLAKNIPPETLTSLDQAARNLGFLSDFSSLHDTLLTYLAAEVRGWTDHQTRLLRNNFDATAPADQIALVHLLAKDLLRNTLLPPPSPTDLDLILARELLTETLALHTSRAFAETQPAHFTSASQNLREAILGGLPLFFYEIISFPEFHLLPLFETAQIPEGFLITPPSRANTQLLLLPKTNQPNFNLQANTPFNFGAIPFAALLRLTDNNNQALPLAKELTAGTLTNLQNDQATLHLTFTNPAAAQQTHLLLTNSFSTLRPTLGITFQLSQNSLTITSKQLPPP